MTWHDINIIGWWINGQRPVEFTLVKFWQISDNFICANVLCNNERISVLRKCHSLIKITVGNKLLFYFSPGKWHKNCFWWFLWLLSISRPDESREGRFLSAHLDLLSAASSLFPSLKSRYDRVDVDYEEDDLVDTSASLVSFSKADKLVASENDLSESDTIRGRYVTYL